MRLTRRGAVQVPLATLARGALLAPGGARVTLPPPPPRLHPGRGAGGKAGDDGIGGSGDESAGDDSDAEAEAAEAAPAKAAEAAPPRRRKAAVAADAAAGRAPRKGLRARDSDARVAV